MPTRCPLALIDLMLLRRCQTSLSSSFWLASASLLTGIAFLWPKNGHITQFLADKLLIDFAVKQKVRESAGYLSTVCSAGIMKTIFKLKQLMPQAITTTTTTATCHRHCHKTVSMKITCLLSLSHAHAAGAAAFEGCLAF